MDCNFLITEGDSVCATVHLGAYSITALQRVAHKFTNRCYVHLEPMDEQRVVVRFRAKSSGTELSTMAGEFMNELLDQTLRETVGRETEAVRNLLLAHALSNTSLIRPELETTDPSDDPLGVSVPDDAKDCTAVA